MAKKIKEAKPLSNPFPESFLEGDNGWNHWKRVKKEQHYFTYKPDGEQAVIDYLFEISHGSEDLARKIIHQSRVHGWKGLFQLKTFPNANNTGVITQKPTPTGNVTKGGFGQL